MKKLILFYSLLIFSLLMLFQLSSMLVFRTEASRDWLLLLVAIISIVMGIFYSRSKGNKIAPGGDQPEKLNPYSQAGLTEREYEVLCMINQGYSNKELGEKLFISENTVKTHVSNILVKLDARRRTEALKNAKELKII